jgi:nicotinate phosphoribosyltransferase
VSSSLAGGSHPLGLLTDLYELRMAQTYLREGMTAPATFSLYIRPDRARPWLLAAGLPRVFDALERFRFGAAEVAYLRVGLGFSHGFLSWLRDYEPAGAVVAVPEGTVLLADEPLLEVTGPLPHVQVLETLLMNVVHHSTVIATKAARCVVAARGAALADFGARRAHGVESALEAARVSHLAGFDSTSNLAAGRAFGIPVVGTMAHSFIQAFDDELVAFRSFAQDHPGNVVLLVDTYDTLDGVDLAADVGRWLQQRGERLAGIRLDSGDLDALAREARDRLDAAGLTDASIFASGGLDEFAIRDLRASGAPIDAYGVGTALTTSRDHPASDIAFKLVSYDGVARAKYSEGKVLLPGPKQVYRSDDPRSDVLGTRDESLPGRPLLEPVWRDGHVLVDHDPLASRERVHAELDALPEAWRDPDGPREVPRPAISPGLQRLAAATRERDLR